MAHLHGHHRLRRWLRLRGQDDEGSSCRTRPLLIVLLVINLVICFHFTLLLWLVRPWIAITDLTQIIQTFIEIEKSFVLVEGVLVVLLFHAAKFLTATVKFFDVGDISIRILLDLHHIHCVENFCCVNHTTVSVALLQPLIEQASARLRMLHRSWNFESFAVTTTTAHAQTELVSRSNSILNRASLRLLLSTNTVTPIFELSL